LLEVVALYMNPPDNAVVLCVDEKTGIQTLDRTQPMLPLRATKPRSWTNEYVRHGTRTLLASLDIGTGRVIAHVRKRRTSKDFLAFLDSMVKEYPNQRLAIVLDNLNTHTNEAARKWLETPSARELSLHPDPRLMGKPNRMLLQHIDPSKSPVSRSSVRKRARNFSEKLHPRVQQTMRSI